LPIPSDKTFDKFAGVQDESEILRVILEDTGGHPQIRNFTNQSRRGSQLSDDLPIQLCEKCGAPLNSQLECDDCQNENRASKKSPPPLSDGPLIGGRPSRPASKPSSQSKSSQSTTRSKNNTNTQKPLLSDDEIILLDEA